MLRMTRLYAYLALLMLVLAGCSFRNHEYTGQTTIHPIRPIKSVSSMDTDVADLGTPGMAFVEHADRDVGQCRYFRDLAFEDPGTRTLTISINRCHVKYLADPSPSKEVLAFVTVTDHADNSERKRVFFDSEFVVEGAYLNFSGKTVYGPRPYAGRPITIEFYIVEIDQKENKVAFEAVKQVKSTLALASPGTSIASNLATDIVSALVATNVDDRELNFAYELKPITYACPSVADVRMGGNVLRTGNYVVVKQEFRRRDADWPSLMSFEDELSYPNWLVAPDAEKCMWPNIVYLGGQLYVTRAYVRKMHDVASRWNGSFGSDRIRRRLTPWWSMGFASQERLRQTLRLLNEELISEASDRRTDLAPKKEDYVFSSFLWGVATKADREHLEGAHDWGGPPSGASTCSGGNEASAKDGQGKSDDKAALRVDAQDVVLADYVPYTSKSYLSFTVRDDLSAADETVLTEVEAEAAKRVSDVVFTLTAEQQKTIIGSLGESVRTAVVRSIVRNRLKSAHNEAAMKRTEGELKERFGDAYSSEIAMEVSYRSAMIERLGAATGLKNLLDKGKIAKRKDEVIGRIKDVLPDLRQDYPALARFAESFVGELEIPIPILDLTDGPSSGNSN